MHRNTSFMDKVDNAVDLLTNNERSRSTKIVEDDIAFAKTLHVTGTSTYFLCSKNGNAYRLSSLAQAESVMTKGW